MIYMDYTAHTPPSSEVLRRFVDCETNHPFNPNSTNSLATQTRQQLDEAIQTMANRLEVNSKCLHMTASATEANNMAIKGLCKAYRQQGKHIVTTYLEHSSVNGPIGALLNEGYEVDYIEVTHEGIIDLEHLEELLRPDTVLVAVTHVDGEVGLVQPIQDIGACIKKHSKALFHVDGTQAVGKVPISLKNVDSYVVAAHKFYGLSGVGACYIKDGLMIEPLLHGGLSHSPFRSGTPTLGLIDAMAYAMDTAMENQASHYTYVEGLNHRIRHRMKGLKTIHINSTDKSTPHILNISFYKHSGEEVKEALAQRGICVSTKAACVAQKAPSRPVYALTKNRKLALSTLRISLSHYTTEEEVDILIESLVEIVGE